MTALPFSKSEDVLLQSQCEAPQRIWSSLAYLSLFFSLVTVLPCLSLNPVRKVSLQTVLALPFPPLHIVFQHLPQHNKNAHLQKNSAWPTLTHGSCWNPVSRLRCRYLSSLTAFMWPSLTSLQNESRILSESWDPWKIMGIWHLYLDGLQDISATLKNFGSNQQSKLYATGGFLHPPLSEHLGRSSADVNQCSYAGLLQLRIWHISLVTLLILNPHILFLCELK